MYTNMTSYVSVNDANATATTATTNNSTTVEPTAGVEHNYHTPQTPRSPSFNATSATTATATTPVTTPLYKIADTTLSADTPSSQCSANNCCIDYDCADDSYSDGHEKTDTTPENVKKLDDVIEQQRQQQQQQQQQQQFCATTLHYQQQPEQQQYHATTSDFADPVADYRHNVGLAVAIDDSNAKFCHTKPLYGGKDTLSKSERIESHNSSSSEPCGGVSVGDGLTPATMAITNSNSNSTGNGSNNNVNSDNNAIRADNSESVPRDDDSSASNTTTTNTTTTANNKQSYAFTIDNFNDKESDPEATKAKYKSMMERFQSRHRRGASMSKLETEGAQTAQMTSSASATPVSTRPGRTTAHDSFDTNGDGDMPKVKLRARDRSTSRVRDASKRHSWSPRSSTQEPQQQQSTQTPSAPKSTANASQVQAQKSQTAARRSAGTTKSKPAPLQMPKGAANLVANRTQFTPRSTAMQMALQKVDFLCPQPPLPDLKNYNLEADNISEAGTYTLDGDNYTEEQKDLMNIDKSGRQRKSQRPKDLNLSGSDVEPVLSNTKIPVHISNRTTNVLEVNYYHESEESQQHSQPQSPRYKFASSSATERDLILGTHESAGAYLEKIKSRVLRNATVAKTTPPIVGDLGQKSSTEDEDMGCFTSVTTSGVLAKQSALDPRPKLTRKSSLSTSQIDSSEYVSNEAKLKANTANAYAAGGFTDHQKAEYRLNLFTNQKDTTQKFAVTRSYIESPPDTPNAKMSDTAVLKTAQTKNDWIQEWARNARARSLAAETKSRHHDQSGELMTRSYTCTSDTGGGTDSLTDDSMYSKQCAAAKLNRTLAERYRLAGGDCDYSSDPALSSASYASAKAGGSEGICKPPKSPSKIPSPLHSLGRARSASRTRAPLQNILPTDEEDIYLQKTAAAINNLQQSLSRKNSLKSPTHSGSPRAHSARSHAQALYSPEGGNSPQHSLGSPTALAAATATAYHHSPLHRRPSNDPFNRTAQHLQLMTSSFNEQQLKLLTSGEYLARQMRMRKNSFDGNIGASPVRRAAAAAAAAAAAHAQTARGNGERNEESLSPLRRSSSFSAKIATQRAARPQYSNIYTPPAARHNYALMSGGGGDGRNLHAVTSNANAIKKSASSNNFRQGIGDYDENFQYYINDEDDMGDEYYSSGGEEEEEYEDNYYKDDEDAGHAMHDEDEPSVPLTNTRYNKALLMRIERSKQKVAGKVSSAPLSRVQATASSTSTGGVMACPNTPELPRRGIKSAPRTGASTARQSMPRDTSLSRLASQVPNSLASAKKQLLQTAAGVPSATKLNNQRVQPKYLDISKYKPAQGNNFLRKNESKSTLKAPSDAMKRSPSSSSMGLSRADPSRASNRSVRSVASCMTTSGTSLGGTGRASSAARRDASISKQKEVEMAMWKRRSTYDPMKAAAEDRRKKEEAKRLALGNKGEDVPCESTQTRTPPPYKQQLSLDEQWTEYGEEECI